MDGSSVLIVEDEAIVALDLKLQLQDCGYRVVGVAASGEQAIEAEERHRPNLVLMDVRLQGDMDGIAAARAIGESRNVPVIFLTSHSDDDTVRRAAQTAPYGYLTKPYQIRELRAGIEVALTKARLERQLREADQWFAHTLRCVADGVVVTDLDAKVRFINPAAEALTGWSLDEALGQPVGDVVRIHLSEATATPSAHAARQVLEVLREGRALPVAHALALVARDGIDRRVDETAGPVDDESGQRLGAVVVLRDASQRLAQESKWRASEARFRAAFDAAPLGMALVSFTGQFIQANDAMCRLIGLPREELVNCNQFELTLASDRDHEAQRLHDLLSFDTGVAQFEMRYRRAAAEPVCVLASVSLLRDADVASCYLYQVHDLTAQKQAAEQVAALAEERLRREASEIASSAKSEFLSRVSHEMRTPLNAVMGFAQLLQLQQLSPDPATVGQYADHIHAAGQHLLALVTDLLDLNRAAQGTLRLQAVPVALADVVNQSLQLLQGEAADHGIALDADIDPSCIVMADPLRLRQVLLNVGSNGIKYNREGGRVRFRARSHAPGSIELTVEDAGIGMTPEQVERLFQPFDRLGAERTKIPGTGLGLVISRSLVQEMGGSLTIESASRAGTVVRIALREPPKPGVKGGAGRS